MAKKSEKVVHVLPMTKARINLGQVVRRARLKRECLILEKDGIPVAGIVDIDSLEDILDLEDGEFRKLFRASADDYSRGRVRRADRFLAELGSGSEKKRKRA